MVVSRWLAVLLALAGACAFAVSVWVGTWWSVAEATIGPFGGVQCFGGSDCEPTHGLAWTGASELWLRMATATGVAGAMSLFLATALAGARASGRTPRLLAKTLLVSIATALVSGGYFFFAYGGVPGSESHVGLGVPMYALGAALGIAAAIVVLRTPRTK